MLQEELLHLIYTLARDILITGYGFPSPLKNSIFDPGFAVRGLSVDKKNGVLCKLSHVQRVGLRSVYKGKKPLSPSEIEGIYGESRHIAQNEISQLRPLNDQFAMAEACLIADSIDQFEHKNKIYGEPYSPAAVVDDVKSAIEEVHLSGSLHKCITLDLEKYILPSPKLLQLLDHLKSADKSLFLCTNR